MRNTRLNYTLFGIGFGLAFPLLAIISDCFIFNKLPFQFNSVIVRIQQNPIHYIIFLAPFVLGYTFFRIGGSMASRYLLTKRLRQSNTALNESNQLLDAFNYHVSHDLKTVLNNQLTLAHMIDKYVQQKEYDRVLEISQKLQEVGANGLNTVTSFLKIGEEGFGYENDESIPVEAEINRIVTENQLQNEITVNFRKSAFKTLVINKKVFESILLNLLTNAIKYSTSPSVVTIDLDFQQEAKQITIADNGIGIDLKQVGDQLFKPFNRIKNNLNKEGNGIGLFLVKKMMLSVNGEVSVKSEPGAGTTFILTFHPKYSAL